MPQRGPRTPEATEHVSSSVAATPDRLSSEVKTARQGLDPFTLSPRIFGGRKARQGFAFQDWWIAYTLLGLLLDQTSFSYVRVEGLEDLDVLLTHPARSIERYYQLKSKQEGTGNWTVSRLEQECIFSRFADLYTQFQLTPHDDSREIEFTLILEGDLAKDVLRLSQTNSSSEPIILGCLATATFVQAMPRFATERANVQQSLESAARKMSEDAVLQSLNSLSAELAQKTESDPSLIQRHILEAWKGARDQFEKFVRSIHCESRAPAAPSEQSRLLEDAVIARLVESADISPPEARKAALRLIHSIANESRLPQPTLVDRGLLLQWLGMKPRPILQSKPEVVADFIERVALTSEIQTRLEQDGSVHIYGISKTGKSQLASRLVDASGLSGSCFWFTFSGNVTDETLLHRDLATWVGMRSGVWQILADLEKGHLSRSGIGERLADLMNSSSLLVFDDCHKCSDLAMIWSLRTAASPSHKAKIILLSEHKQAGIESAGIQQVPISGFEPKEVLAFVKRQGIDYSNAILEIVSMSSQFGGHPLMLRAACQLLSKKPTPDEVTLVAARLPSLSSTRSFLEDLSNHLFFDLLRTDNQRALLSRLAVLHGPFDSRISSSVAGVEPHLTTTSADWTFISSTLLDSSSGGRYSFPPALKHVAEQHLAADVHKEQLLIAAGHAQLTPNTRTGSVDFVDFHTAIFSFILAKEYKIAAHYFVAAVPQLHSVADFNLLSIFFTIFNGEPANSALASDFLRWQLLSAEVLFRTKSAETSAVPRVADLLRRMRSIANRQRSRRWLLRFMLLGLLASVRTKRMDPKQQPTTRLLTRLTGAAFLALKIAIANKAAEQAAIFITLFENSAELLSARQIEVLKDAVLLFHEAGERNISPNRLAHIYARFAIRKNQAADARRQQLYTHADEFRAAGLLPAYVSAEHALALFEHEHDGNYEGARERLRKLLAVALTLRGGSRLLVDRINVLIADTYWAEADYESSSAAYSVAMKGHHVRRVRQHIQQRLLDSMLASRRFAQAAKQTVMILRRRRAVLSATEKVLLYGRLAYACAESGELSKAAIACLSLDRIARRSRHEELQCLSLSVAAWVLQHASFSDPLIPRPSIEISDSSAISDKIDPEHLNAWRKEDRLSTKARMQIATVFELREMYKRSESLLSQVLAATKQDQDSSAHLHAFNLRFIRLYLLTHRIPAAARVFKETVAESVDNHRFSPEVVTFSTWEILEQTLLQVSDHELVKFADELFGSLSNWPQAQAAVRFQQSRALFARFLVTDARFRLLDAEDLARTSLAAHILAKIYSEKLFFRHFHHDWRRWLEDALNAFLELSRDCVSGDSRRYFAGVFRSFIETNRKQFGPPISNLEEYWSEHPFEVATTIILRTATRFSVSTKPVAELRQWLRSNEPSPMFSQTIT